MKKVMAVYDEDPFYAERLSDYVNKKETGVFTAQAFTSREKLEEFAKENGIDVLLTGSPPEKDGSAGLKGVQKIYLTENQGEKGDGTWPEIYKYQSGDDIIREVMAAYCEMPGTQEASPGLFLKEKRILGIYSPIGRCGKTSLALSVGQVLAKEEKVLFITLDTFSGFSSLLEQRWKRDLSDLIYYYKQGRFHALRLNAVVYFLGDMAWLPPIRFPDDYNQITAEEMADFLRKISETCDYSTIVLDVGNYGKQVLPILEACQVIYMPVREDIISQAKLEEFDAYLEECGKKNLRERIRRVHVPMVTGAKKMGQFPKELLWGDLGDFVRGMLTGKRSLWES